VRICIGPTRPLPEACSEPRKRPARLLYDIDEHPTLGVALIIGKRLNDQHWIEPNDARHRMKNPFEVLQKKELELRRVRQEVEALRLVTPLLVE